MSNYIFWTDEEINKLTNLISQKKSFEQISKEFPGRTTTSLQSKAAKLGLTNNYHFQKYTIDTNFFLIPNLTNSYFAGFFAADGYLRTKGNAYNFKLELCTKDVIVLENFKYHTKYTGNIRSYQRKNYLKETLKNVSCLSVSCANPWGKQLKENFGIVPHKTYRMSPPNLNDENLNLAYLIGYVDGDGSVFIRSNNRIVFRIYSSNLKIISWLRNILVKNIPILQGCPEIYKRKNENCFDFLITGLNAGIIIDYLRQFPVPHLKRKWQNPAILAKIADYKTKYPELFQYSFSQLVNNSVTNNGETNICQN